MKYTTAGEHTKPGLPSLTGDSFKEIGSLDPSLETDATDIDKKSLNDIAFAVGLIAVSAGAINPDTKVAYGSKTGKQNKSISLWKTLKRFMGMSKSTNFELPEAQEITKKIIDIPIEKMQAIGTQALTIMALSHFLSGKELELPQLPALKERLETATLTNEEYPQNPTIEHLRQLALTTEREALSWGVERALDLLSLDDSPLEKFEGKTIRERVEEYVAKHRDQWSQLSPEGQKEALIELHRVVGGGSISSDYAFDKYKIPYHEESKTLLHLQTLGKAQCVVFSILAWQVLNRTNTPHRVASVPEHVFLEVGNTGNLFYDGAAYEAICTKFSGIESPEKSDKRQLFASTLNNLGITYTEMQKPKEAIECYRAALKINPNHVNALNSLGVTEVLEGNYEEAIRCYQAALKINPNHVNALCNLGNAYVGMKEYAKAIECYQAALENNPNHVNALCNLGVAYRRMKNYEEAIRCCEQALEINPNHLGARQMLDILRKKIRDRE